MCESKAVSYVNNIGVLSIKLYREMIVGICELYCYESKKNK